MADQSALGTLLQGLQFEAAPATPTPAMEQASSLWRPLAAQLAALPTPKQDRQAWLNARSTLLTHQGSLAWQRAQQALRQQSVQSHPNPMAPVHDMARGLDALLRFVYDQALNEVEAFRNTLLAQAEQGLASKQQKSVRSHSHSNRAKEVSRARLRTNPSGLPTQPKTSQTQAAQLAAQQAAQQRQIHENTLAALHDWQATPSWVKAHLCVFARGGYGRGELCFESDLDLGSCVLSEEIPQPYSSQPAPSQSAEQPQAKPPPAKTLLLREVVVRMQEMLRMLGINPAHQYFELGEDLQRFTIPKTLHTLTSVLEGRSLAGEASILTQLQQQVWAVLPSTTYIETKTREFNALSKQPNGGGGLHLKQGRGSLRAIQSALWLVGINQQPSQANQGIAPAQANPFHPAALLQQAYQQNLLSLWECAHLVRTFELVWCMRAAHSALQQHPFTQAPSHGKAGQLVFHLKAAKQCQPALPKGLQQHPAAREAQALWGLLHRLLQQAHKIAKALMENALQTTITTQLTHTSLDIHPAKRHILAIQPNPASWGAAAPQQESLLPTNTAANSPPPPGQLSLSPLALLEILAHAAQAGLDFAPQVQSALAETIAQCSPSPALASTNHPPSALIGQTSSEARSHWQQLLLAPYASTVLQQLAAVFDPFNWYAHSLLGCFLPLMDTAAQHLQGPYQSNQTLQCTALLALEQATQELNHLAEEYPQWHALLSEEDVLALKSAALLHVCCYVEGLPKALAAPPSEAQSTLAALEDLVHQHQQGLTHLRHSLTQLGFEDASLREKTSLLVLHHRSLALISDKGYPDEALAHCFALVNQRLETLLLLFMINLASLGACGEQHQPQQQALRDNFATACHLLQEMHGVPQEDEALALINQRLDAQKEALRAETRFQALVQQCIEQGMGPALYAPLRKQAPDVWQQLQSQAPALEALQLRVTMSEKTTPNSASLQQRFAESLRALLPQPTLLRLTRSADDLWDWFFHAFPNRHLMRCHPAVLARQSRRFAGFRSQEVVVDSLLEPESNLAEVLVFSRNLKQSHTRVAYALSRRSMQAINIVNGKVNPLHFQNGQRGYCYSLQIAGFADLPQSWNKDMEWTIRNAPPALLTPPTFSNPPGLNPSPPPPAHPAQATTQAAANRLKRGENEGKQATSTTQVHFYPPDDKSYVVQECAQGFERQASHQPYVHIQQADTPLAFYQLCQVFDAFGIEFPQATLATLGDEMSDHFYLDEASHQTLGQGAFSQVVQQLFGA